MNSKGDDPLSTPAEVVEANDTTILLTVDAAHDGHRLDRVLASLLPNRSRSQLQRHIALGAVLVDGADPRHGARTLVHAGSVIAHRAPPETPTSLVPRAIPLDVLFEDEHILEVMARAEAEAKAERTRGDR